MGGEKTGRLKPGGNLPDSPISEAARLLAVAAHDLRTPLGSMTAIIDLLEQTDLTPEQQDLLARLRTAGGYLRDLSDQLIASEQREFLADREPDNFNPAETLRTLVALHDASSHVKDVHLVEDLDPDLNGIYAGFPLALQRIVGNLLENAVKFTPQGTVTVSAGFRSEADRQNLVVCVSDEGPGMAPHELQKLFSPFEQGAAGHNSRQGSGLGLWISYRLADALGGSLSAKSDPGKGTTMRLCLPLFPPLQDQSEQEASPGNPEDYRKCIAGKSVLAVDDNPASREILVSVLESFGMTVTPASTGEEALDCAQKQSFDVFVLDLNLPGKSGAEVALLLQQDARNGGSVFLALTAGMRPDVAEDYEKAKFDGFVGKPFAVTVLFGELGRILAAREQS